MVLVNRMSVYRLLTACLLLCASLLVVAQDAPAIPAEKIAALEAAAARAKKARPRSSTQRRIYKGIIRNGKALVAAHPEADNRFQVLGIMLKNQKVLLNLEKNDRNRTTLFEICSQLAKAPDKWATVRLDADVLLSERDLAELDQAFPSPRGRGPLEIL